MVVPDPSCLCGFPVVVVHAGTIGCQVRIRLTICHPNVLAFTLLSTSLSGGRHAQHWITRTSFTINSETSCSHFLLAPHVVFHPLHKFR